jgi:hypothetical protein
VLVCVYGRESSWGRRGVPPFRARTRPPSLSVGRSLEAHHVLLLLLVLGRQLQRNTRTVYARRGPALLHLPAACVYAFICTEHLFSCHCSKAGNDVLFAVQASWMGKALLMGASSESGLQFALTRGRPAPA